MAGGRFGVASRGLRRAGIGVAALLLAGLAPALAGAPHMPGTPPAAPCMSGSNQDGWVTWNPTSLWPPNHKLITINISYNDGSAAPDNAVPNGSSDNDSSMKTVSVASVTIDPADSVGSGNPNGVDVGAAGAPGAGTDPAPANTTQQVASERQGPSKAGRTYTITVNCTDMGGSSMENFSGQATLTVTVPHDQGVN